MNTLVVVSIEPSQLKVLVLAHGIGFQHLALRHAC
jgi:hypothetical protein